MTEESKTDKVVYGGGVHGVVDNNGGNAYNGTKRKHEGDFVKC
jgi:hypothetical protein